jgi:ATP-dependent Clp protease ATP-binding subunit ClpC
VDPAPIPLTDQTRALLDRAGEEAQRLRHCTTTAAHILMCVQRSPPTYASHLLEHFGIDVDQLRSSTERAATGKTHTTPEPDLVTVVEAANAFASQYGEHYVGTEHVLLAVIERGGSDVTLAFDRVGHSRQELLAKMEAYVSDMIQSGQKALADAQTRRNRGDSGGMDCDAS